MPLQKEDVLLSHIKCPPNIVINLSRCITYYTKHSKVFLFVFERTSTNGKTFLLLFFLGQLKGPSTIHMQTFQKPFYTLHWWRKLCRKLMGFYVKEDVVHTLCTYYMGEKGKNFWANIMGWKCGVIGNTLSEHGENTKTLKILCPHTPSPKDEEERWALLNAGSVFLRVASNFYS